MLHIASSLPGLGGVLAEELAGLGAPPRGTAELDGRNDLVAALPRSTSALQELRCAEDVFAAVSECRIKRLSVVLDALWDDAAMERALSAWAAWNGPLRARMTYRVIARLQDESLFQRRELREGLAQVVERRRGRWSAADPAQLELWVVEAGAGRLRLLLRLSNADMRHRTRRVEQWPGALRPTVAAAMVRLAGEPRGVLLDPCCGSGTILGEALAVGWTARGSDLDPEAVRIARRNLPRTVPVATADVRDAGATAGTAGAVVSNLPFGDRHAVQGDPATWYRRTLEAVHDVLVPRGAAVLLAPPSAPFRAALRATPQLHTVRRIDLELLGKRSTIWSLRRG